MFGLCRQIFYLEKKTMSLIAKYLINVKSIPKIGASSEFHPQNWYLRVNSTPKNGVSE